MVQNRTSAIWLRIDICSYWFQMNKKICLILGGIPFICYSFKPAVRGLVCGVCFRKSKHHQRITPTVLALIQKHGYKDYSIDDPSLPYIICKSCAKTLKVLDSENPNRKLPYFDYGGLVKPALVNTRLADSDKCQCTICNISRLNENELQKHEKTQRNNPGRAAEKVYEISYSITQCSNCHSEIGRGRPKDCTRTARQDNLLDLVRNHSGKTQEQLASKLLDAIYED